MSQVETTRPRNTRALKAVTAGAVVLAVIEGATSGTFSSLANYLTSFLAPAAAPSSDSGRTAGGAAAERQGGPAATPAAALVDVKLSSPAGTRAHLVIGRIGTFMAGRDAAQYSLGSSVPASDGRCIESIVIDGLQPGNAAIFAAGLPRGLSAAEGVPPQAVQAGSAHQQLVLLSASDPGVSRSVGGELVSGGTRHPLGRTAVTLTGVQDGVATWDVGGQRVSCEV